MKEFLQDVSWTSFHPLENTLVLFTNRNKAIEIVLQLVDSPQCTRSMTIPLINLREEQIMKLTQTATSLCYINPRLPN
jgi:hypothetical protein